MVKHDKSHGVQVSTEYNRSKSPVAHSYLYAHSQQIYLLDREGRTRALFFIGSPLDEMRDAVLALLEEPVGLPAPDCDAVGAGCPGGPAGHGTHKGTEEDRR
jgi:hypothetical protein